MACGAAVVMEVDPVLDRRGHEPQHLLALMPDSIAIAPDFRRDAKVDAEASAQSLDAADDTVLGDQRAQPRIEPLANGVDLLVKARAEVRGHGRQPSRHSD